MHSLGAVVLVHDRRYAQNHVLDILAAAMLRLDPEGVLPLQELTSRLSRGLSLTPDMLASARLQATRERLLALGLIGLRPTAPVVDPVGTPEDGGR
ncbi:MAG: hypothetical protein D6757_11420 [Alphaproteobacteria bacterium]|nr:MAG: hypothetical protein D6757_11420 [Alphaproteobacteria bacterium]